MGKCIGIDLGTTNSVACVMHTEPEILLNREMDKLTPSAVAFKRSKKTGDAIMVGKLAENYAKMAGKDYLYSIKRLMGRSFEDEDVQKLIDRVSYSIVASPDGKEDVVRVSMGETLYTPTEISAMILKKIKEDVEFRLGEKIDSAVITVPAYFSERQKHDTREAGLMAGLKVKKVIDEPTAAAIAYGIGQNDDKDRMVLVFDLGGGTFDVSILLMIGGTFTQMDNEGDMWLGGDDFDRLIMDQVIRQVEAEEGIKDLSQNREFVHELKKKAREAKEILSSQEAADIIITDVLKDEDGMPIPVEYEITRSEFVRLIAPFVDKSMAHVKKSLEEASLEKDDIDAVLLVGGSSTIPKFQSAVEAFFGPGKVHRGIDAMTCVAQGAGILAKSLADKIWCTRNHENSWEAEKCGECEENLMAIKKKVEALQDDTGREVTPKPYGIEIEGDRFAEIIPKNTPYPTEEPYPRLFKTTMADQRIVKIPVREGFSEKASENEFMGNIWFYGLPPGLPEGTPIEVSMDLDSDMIFTIGCNIRGIDWSRQLTLQHGGWQNPALDQAMDCHIEAKKHDLAGAKAEDIEKHVQGIQNAVEKNDESAARAHMEALGQIKVEDGGEKMADWRIRLQNVINTCEANMERVAYILPDSHEKIQELKAWISEAKKVLESDDDPRGEEMVQTGIAKMLDTPLVGELAVANLVSGLPGVDPAFSTRLEQAKQEFLQAIDRKDVAGIEASIVPFRKLCGEAFQHFGQPNQGPVDIKVLLGGSS